MTDTLPVADDTHKYVRRLTKNGAGDHRSALRSPRGAISVRQRRPAYDSGTWIDESHRRDRLTPVRLEWERLATSLNASLAAPVVDVALVDQLKRRRAYALARVARLTADIAPRLVGCGVESLPIKCGCGPVGARKTCRQSWLCGDCRAKRVVSLGADIRRGLTAALSEAVSEWGAAGGRGMKPRLILLTFTAAHTGNLVTDQEALSAGWRGLYKRMNEDYGKFPYVGVWEVTPGADGMGHVHMHVACIWRYRDWWRIRAQWESACPSSHYLDIKKNRKDGKPSSPSSVGNYLGKYLSKGVNLGGFDARLRAETSAAFYNKHAVVTSADFWRRVPKCCAKCHERYRLYEVDAPEPFWHIPMGVLSLDFSAPKRC